MLHHGDCIEVMATLPEASVDAIVTDPPYGLEFMGKAWDHGAIGRPFADAMYRIAKPSAYLLAFGGTRTVHRMTCALEDAGWIIRDMLVWGYASGFPKSKASLKPAWEPIVMARKPGPLRMLAIDECRIGTGGDKGEWPITDRRWAETALNAAQDGSQKPRPTDNSIGRWPANIVLTDPIFDGGIEGVVGGWETGAGGNINGRPVTGYSKGWADERWFEGYSDTGTYSRFFLVPKAARSDREPVLRPDYEARRETAHRRSGPMDTPFLRGETMRLNPHPTVKPTDLMRHLVRLVTPTGGTVLDPFAGSGSTLIAADLEGFEWIGIEREEEYIRIAEARLNGTQLGMAI